MSINNETALTWAIKQVDWELFDRWTEYSKDDARVLNSRQKQAKNKGFSPLEVACVQLQKEPISDEEKTTLTKITGKLLYLCKLEQPDFLIEDLEKLCKFKLSETTLSEIFMTFDCSQRERVLKEYELCALKQELQLEKHKTNSIIAILWFITKL